MTPIEEAIQRIFVGTNNEDPVEAGAYQTAVNILKLILPRETQERQKLYGLFEDELKRNMRINMPGISNEQQEETWQRYKKLNNL